jgi:hypothetical protein
MKKVLATLVAMLSFVAPLRASVLPAAIPDRAPITMYDPSYKTKRHVIELKGVVKRLKEKIQDVREAVRSLIPVPGNVVALGLALVRGGFRVSEHPAFGGVGVHAPGSDHYTGHAIDVNEDGNEMSRLDRLAAWIRKYVPGAEILWRVAGHFDHLHVSM